MKKLTTLLLALMTIIFTQCKPEPIDNTDENTDTRKVKVRCEIPLGNGSRSDFTNLMTDGSIKWSAGTERIYLAVHHEDASKAQIVELTAETTLPATVLAFEGEVAEDILTNGETYNVWYLGNSMNLETPYVTKTETAGVITSVNGSIANQSGSLEDLGYHHIAKAEVTATKESDGSFTLPLHGTLQNQIAIAYLDLTGVNSLTGSAIIGTDYSLEYSNGEYNFVVSEENKEISIDPNQSASESVSKSFVVLLPNAETNVDIVKGNNIHYKYTFKDGIAASSFYYRYISDVEIGTLKFEYQLLFVNGHEYIDLGLPSGIKWATCNVGADTPEEYGDYYSWGETTTKEEYNECTTYGVELGDIGGNAQYDAATANWGDGWRMPTKAEQQELIDNCTWVWMTDGVEGFDGVNGCKVTGPNGNHIFLPAAGLRMMSTLIGDGICMGYWSSTPDGNTHYAYCLYLEVDYSEDCLQRIYGESVRPVTE